MALRSENFYTNVGNDGLMDAVKTTEHDITPSTQAQYFEAWNHFCLETKVHTQMMTKKKVGNLDTQNDMPGDMASRLLPAVAP